MQTTGRNTPSTNTASKPVRRSRILFSIAMAMIALFLIWPGYVLFSSATPFILGFPLSFAWIIFCTIAGFIAMLALYISDHKNEENR